MKTLVNLVLATTAGLLSFGALAGPKCTDAPRDKWLPAATMKARILKDGYTIDKFKVSGQCYEIYGQDKDGRDVEIYFDPTDGRIVKQRSNDD
ncbi:MAG TPA: PepSY domain-containing protein [Luteimonas sp.]|nr:PepSY domain-containing protein [Luteimonas sp.]